MKEIAIGLLAFIHETNTSGRAEWDVFPRPVQVFVDYVYNSGIWDGAFREKLKALESMKPSGMSLSDLNSYFTAIVCIERSFGGFVEQKTYDGTLEALLTRYLELTGEGTR